MSLTPVVLPEVHELNMDSRFWGALGAPWAFRNLRGPALGWNLKAAQSFWCWLNHQSMPSFFRIRYICAFSKREGER